MVYSRGCQSVSQSDLPTSPFTDIIHRTANACYKEAADLYAEVGNYRESIARYEQVARNSLGSELTKFSVKEYLLRAGLCAVATFVSVSTKFVLYII